MNERGKHRTFCCVLNCKSTAQKRPDLSFHLFPKHGTGAMYIETSEGSIERVDRKTAWERKLLMRRRASEYMKVCSLHFKPEDFYPSLTNKSKHVLKKNAIPISNLPRVKHTAVLEALPFHERKVHNKDCFERNNESIDNDHTYNISYTEEEAEVANSLLVIASDSSEDSVSVPALKTNTTKSARVLTGDVRFNFCALIDSDRILCSLTGLPTLKLLEILTITLTGKVKNSAVPVRERIVMTLMTLKKNVSCVVLSLIFDSANASTIKNLIIDTISALACALAPIGQWIGSDIIKKNTPESSAKFPDVQVLLDCTEIVVEKPKCLECRLKFYSQYKSDPTIKFLTGVSPAGLIICVNRASGGKAPDKMFKQRSLINQIESGKAVVVYKGFLSDGICNASNINIIRPPLPRKKKHLSAEEQKYNVETARARVLVERVNRHIKTFDIISQKFPFSLVSKSEEIFLIVCALTNFSAAVLEPDK